MFRTRHAKEAACEVRNSTQPQPRDRFGSGGGYDPGAVGGVAKVPVEPTRDSHRGGFLRHGSWWGGWVDSRGVALPPAPTEDRGPPPRPDPDPDPGKPWLAAPSPPCPPSPPAPAPAPAPLPPPMLFRCLGTTTLPPAPPSPPPPPPPPRYWSSSGSCATMSGWLSTHTKGLRVPSLSRAGSGASVATLHDRWDSSRTFSTHEAKSVSRVSSSCWLVTSSPIWSMHTYVDAAPEAPPPPVEPMEELPNKPNPPHRPA